MDPRLADLIKLLDLERLEVDLFRGESRDIGSPQVFGGQVLGQALTAATATVEGRTVHSLHAYFLRRGDFNAPIVYQVDRSLDGHSFCNRRVVAIQHGAPIFNMAASFQISEEGFEHQIAMPAVPPPESLPDASRPPPELLARLPPAVRRFLERPRPFEFRLVQPMESLVAAMDTPSDYFLLDTATLPHGKSSFSGALVMASIDHAMWFHRPLRVDDWLLYAVESPSASGARGFARAGVYARDGRLVASTAQEGLVRVRRPAEP
jgi:acyl-CoA thioesterase-2